MNNPQPQSLRQCECGDPVKHDGHCGCCGGPIREGIWCSACEQHLHPNTGYSLCYRRARAERLASRCPEWVPPTETDPTAEMTAFLKEE